MLADKTNHIVGASPRHHVVITGTGRAGTTFLVDLLTHLGLDTGYDVESLEFYKYPGPRAGLELDIRDPQCPYIIKSPWFSGYAQEVLCRDDIVIDHIFIPFRDLYAAAQSRRAVSEASFSSLTFLGLVKHMLQPRHWFRPKAFPGGLCGTASSQPGAQEAILLNRSYQLLLAVSDSQVPITLLRYPRLTRDTDYLYRKLGPLVRGIDYQSFREVFERVVRPELVNRFGENDV